MSRRSGIRFARQGEPLFARKDMRHRRIDTSIKADDLDIQEILTANPDQQLMWKAR
jgi:hypothetical protein